MKLVFFEHARADYLYWQHVAENTTNRINQLIKADRM